jgi:hypothetical protein
VEPEDRGLRFESFPERPLEEAEAVLSRLISRGALLVETATPDDLRAARIPSTAGGVFLALARRYRAVVLTEAELRIELHDGWPADDPLGGWRLVTEPDMIDLRLGLPSDPAATCDTLYDATVWPDARCDAVRHSSVVHFLVRAIAGDAHGA